MLKDPEAILQELMNAVDQKMAGLKQKVTSGAELGHQSKVEVLRVLLSTLQRNGVDPNDQEAVNAFLEQLKQANPEVYEVFELALNDILDGFASEKPENSTISDKEDQNGDYSKNALNFIDNNEDNINLSLNKQLDGKEKFKSYLKEAETLIFLKRFEDLLDFCDKILEFDQNNITVLDYKAKALSNLGKWQEEINVCEKILEIEPNNIYGLSLKSSALFSLGKDTEALNICDNVLKIDPANILALNAPLTFAQDLGFNDKREIIMRTIDQVIGDQEKLKVTGHLPLQSHVDDCSNHNKGVLSLISTSYVEQRSDHRHRGATKRREIDVI